MSDERSDTLSTYRHLRLAMVLLLALLLVAVALRAISAPPGLCFEGSISAYYFTSVRAVFVASLCAIGTGLIVYRGNTDSEDIALNVSGAFAFVVAFVPTSTPSSTGVSCSASNVPGPVELEEAINNNMWSLIIVFAAAIGIAMILLRRAKKDPGKAPVRALWALLAVLGIGAACFALRPDGFRANAHGTAALLTFGGILVVVGLNARGAHKGAEELAAIEAEGAVATEVAAKEAKARRYRNAYGLVALFMITAAAAVGLTNVLVSDWRHAILVIETALLVGFLVFWLLQTSELWDTTRRDLLNEPSPAAPSPEA